MRLFARLSRSYGAPIKGIAQLAGPENAQERKAMLGPIGRRLVGYDD
jgi:hypothetical protein